MRRRKIPRDIALRKQLAEYMMDLGHYSMFEVVLYLGYSLRDFQLQVNSPLLSRFW